MKGNENEACTGDNLTIIASDHCDVDLSKTSIEKLLFGPLCGKFFKGRKFKTNESSICIYFKSDGDVNRGRFSLEASAVNKPDKI